MFRDPTTVDLQDVDFFALVGPTGSGKSTVLDSICFALYGTVPGGGIAARSRTRWPRRRPRRGSGWCSSRPASGSSPPGVVRRDAKGKVTTGPTPACEQLPPGFDDVELRPGPGRAHRSRAAARCWPAPRPRWTPPSPPRSVYRTSSSSAACCCRRRASPGSSHAKSGRAAGDPGQPARPADIPNASVNGPEPASATRSEGGRDPQPAR